MKLTMAPGTTSKIMHLFIQDSSSTTGAGLTGVAFGDITAYYMRAGAAAPVSITLATIATIGTYATGGFKEVDATNLPGVYEFHPPNAMLAAGAAQVVAMLKGATNMAPLPLEIQLGSGLFTLDGETLEEAIAVIRAGSAGLADGFPSGPIHYRNKADTKDRITATVDGDGNRTVIAVDLT